MKTGPASFFDDPELTTIKKLWRPVPQPDLQKLNVSLGNEFIKATKSFGQGKIRHYFVDEEYLYTSRKPDPKLSYGYVSLYGARVDFLTYPDATMIKAQDKEPIYGFRIFRNQKKVEFFTKDAEIYAQWKTALRGRALIGTFHDDFQVEKMIGKGSFARVYLATKNETSQQYAIKAFNKEFIGSQDKGMESILNEISIMRRLDHPGAIKLYEAHETNNSLYFVLDIVSGGDLFKYIKEKQAMPEKDIQKLMVNMLKFLAYLTDKNILHRDIKPENILLRNANNPSDVVLADFGLATLATGQVLFKRCGTPGYVGPEVLKYKDGEPLYSTKCDVFSTGIVLYMLLTGEHPFNGKGCKAILRQNKDVEIDYNAAELKKVNPKTMQLLKGMLTADPNTRLSAKDCLHHPFLVDEAGDAIIDLKEMAKNEQAFQKELQARDSNIPDSLLLKSGGSPAMHGETDTIEMIGSRENNGSLGENMQPVTQGPAKPSRFGVKPRAGTIDCGTSKPEATTYQPSGLGKKKGDDMHKTAIRNSISKEGQQAWE